jgi:hypothetical protein
MDTQPDQLSAKADEAQIQPKDDHEPSSDEKTLDEKPEGQAFGEITFPEGGARAWSVAFGAAGTLFCTFGYANAFGCVLQHYMPRGPST